MTAPKLLPLLNRVNELLTYDPLSGEFRWRISTNSRVRAGQLAGSFDTAGYRRIRIDGRRYLAHRLAWLVTKQVWPTDQIDHIDGVKDNNRIGNLREATCTENNQNRSRQSNNSSGYTGVSFDTKTGRWHPYIGRGGRIVHLGLFDTLEEAIAARQAAEILYFKTFRRLHTPAPPAT